MAIPELYSTYLFSDVNLLYYLRFENNLVASKGSLTGGATSLSYVAGQFGQCISFTAAASRCDLTVISLRTVGTISFWFKVSSLASTLMLVSDRSSTLRSGTFQLQVNTSGTLTLLVSNGSSWVVNATSSKTVSQNVWHHLSWSWDATNGHEIYIDTELWVSSASTQGLFTGVETVIIGNLYDYNYGNNKMMDDFAIFIRRLTATERSYLYQGISFSPNIMIY